MTSEQKNDAVTVSSSVEAKDIHKKGDPMKTSSTGGKFPRESTTTSSGLPREKNPTSSSLLNYVCYLVWSHTGDSLEKTVLPINLRL